MQHASQDLLYLLWHQPAMRCCCQLLACSKPCLLYTWLHTVGGDTRVSIIQQCVTTCCLR